MADDYTPTDGEVLESWAAHNTPDLPTALYLEASYDSFKRWLAEHDAALIEGLADEVGYSLVHHEEAEAFLHREARQRREEQGS